jgi:hypothetical protein
MRQSGDLPWHSRWTMSALAKATPRRGEAFPHVRMESEWLPEGGYLEEACRPMSGLTSRGCSRSLPGFLFSNSPMSEEPRRVAEGICDSVIIRENVGWTSPAGGTLWQQRTCTSGTSATRQSCMNASVRMGDAALRSAAFPREALVPLHRNRRPQPAIRIRAS